ncbi:MOSC domain-containing protein [filamentous cyanobacterium CCP5]|nr:MOSC domain-containing protein [filamentous cyanobacterium CCP5]
MAIYPQVARLTLYPIKSLDGVEVEMAEVLPSGALRGDRQWAIVDDMGNFVNGKREARVHGLRSRFDLAAATVDISAPSQGGGCFHLGQELGALETWLSDYFGYGVKLERNQETGFPDDTDSPGPTLISTATLEAVASWYPQLTVEEVRRRFRSNIEIGEVPAFWEDALFAEAGQPVLFHIGSVGFSGVNPCQRCVVVTRDSQTGSPLAGFQKTFIAQRQATLPDWSERSRFNHFFRLAVNTRLASPGLIGCLQIADPIRLASGSD